MIERYKTLSQISTLPIRTIAFRLLTLPLLAICATPAWSQVCDVDNDADIDRLDIDQIFAARNQSADPGDPRDENQDGTITVNDARACVVQCTLPRCLIITPTENRAPIADAGDDQAVFPGITVTLDGQGSSDPDGDSLTFRWTLLSAPSGSQSSLDDPTSSAPVFVPDISGTYAVQLVVNDGATDSAPDAMQVTTRSVGYELDLSNQQTAEIGPAGGVLSLTDAVGRSFRLEIPGRAVNQSTEFILTAVSSIDDLPDGLLPVAGIRMQPAGLEFPQSARLTFELLPSDRNGPWIALLTDDVGENLLLRTLHGVDPRSAALNGLIVSVDVPHFSTAVIAEVEQGAVIPPPPPLSDAQAQAIHAIETRIAELLQVIELLGVPDSDDISLIDDPIVTLALIGWLDSIQVRLDDLAVNPNIDNLKPLQDLMFESIEMILEAAIWLGEDIGGQFDILEDAIIGQLAETIASYFLTAKDRCATDSLGAQDILNSIEDDILEQFTSSSLTDMFEDDVFDCGYTVTLSPPFQAAFVGSTVDIAYDITLEDGTEFAGSRIDTGAASSLSLDNLALVAETEDTFTVTSASGLLGLTTLTLEIGAGPPTTAEVLFVPNFVDSYGASGNGSASGCTDPEDDGPGGGAENIDFVTQSLLSASRNQAVIGIAGVGTIVTGIDLTVTLTGFGANAATGSVFGGASFRVVEVDTDENGDPVTFIDTGSGSLTGSVTATTSGNTFGLSFQGSSGDCAVITGTILIASF